MIWRALTVWCLLTATCLANVDTAQEQLSVMQIGMPWRNVSVDPTATNDTPQQLATLGHFGAPYEVTDMTAVTTRRVYDENLAGVGIATDGDMTAYIEARTVNAELANYDWSGLSVGTYHASYGGSGYNHSVPTTMISARHGISAKHNMPAVGAKVWFREPDGDAVIATCEARTQLTNSGAYLIRFTGNPSAELARYPICTDASLQLYDGGALWLFYQTLKLKLRVMDGFSTFETYDTVAHVDGSWNVGTITEGSSRPALVALTNNRLIITGTMETGAMNCRISEDIAEIESAISGYSETLLTSDLPAPNYNSGAIATGGFLSGYLQGLNGNLQ